MAHEEREIEERHRGDRIAIDAAAGIVSMTFDLGGGREARIDLNPETAEGLATGLNDAVKAARDQLWRILRRGK